MPKEETQFKSNPAVPPASIESDAAAPTAVNNAPAAAVTKTALDSKLEYFQYNENATYYEWERENPMQIPLDVAEKYPQLAFRFRAKDESRGLRHGVDYHGWQRFSDGSHPTGIEVGGDLVLCAMPKERAEAYRKAVANRSTEAVKGIQDQQLEAMERVEKEMQAYGGEAVGNITVGARRFPVGSPTGPVTEQYRGYHPEELRERQIKQREERAKHRTHGYTKNVRHRETER